MSLTAPATIPAQSPPTYARRFGRTYCGLDNFTTASICSRNVGKVRADCRLRVSKSQWGSLGVPGNPAAIVYMDIAIDQPSNCRLETASVLITLDEHSSSKATEPREKCLQMTDYYGPKQLSGEATKVTLSRSVHLVPQINVMGSGGGGIGVERERSTSYHTRWTFTGGLQAGEQMSPFYRTLKWELRENESGARSNRSPIIHTAFALQHSDRPFIMRIEIQGRLQGSRDRLRQKMRGMRFPSPNYPEQGRSETLVRPNTVALRRRPLDMLAMGLSNAMERENLMRVPVEIPETLPVSFSVDDDARAATPQPDAQSSAQRMPDMHLNCHSEPTIIMPGSTSGMLLAPDDATSIAGTRQPSSVSNLSSSATLVGTPHEAFSPVSADSSAILGSAVDRFNGCNWERCRWEETPQSKEAVSTPEHATLAVLVRYPILHFLWRIIASILGAVPISKSSYEKKTTQDRGASGQETDPLSLPYPGQWPPE